MNICKYCGQFFKSLSALHEHEGRHKNEGPHKCPICDKVSFSKYHHDTHVKRHSSDKPYCCVTCGASFKTPHDLKRHEQRKKERFTCGDCGQVCQSKVDLNDHMGKHTGETQHVCTHAGCGKTFRYKNNLYRHRKSHTGDKFTCDHCGKLYDSKGALVAHVKYTESQQIVKCPICKKQIKSKKTLQKHHKENH